VTQIVNFLQRKRADFAAQARLLLQAGLSCRSKTLPRHYQHEESARIVGARARGGRFQLRWK
jgi:hypothetical protein